MYVAIETRVIDGRYTTSNKIIAPVTHEAADMQS